MKPGDLFEALERFFIDIVGTVLPGLAMIVGLCYVAGKPLPSFSQILFNRNSEYEWVLLLGFSYALGHGVTGLGSRIRGILENICQRKLIKKHKTWLLKYVLSESEHAEKLAQDPLFRTFLDTLRRRIPSLAAQNTEPASLRTWRSLALSFAQEHSHLVYRFTFLSLLNLGIATVLISTSIVWFGLNVAKGLGVSVEAAGLNIWLPVLLLASPLFLERYYYFSKIAFKLPISMAVAKLGLQEEPSKSKLQPSPMMPSATTPLAKQKLRVYLAGGFQTGWQDAVMQAVPSLDYFDPRSHGLMSKTEYTAWDLEALRRSDCVFAYLEASNPGGYALALEIGFAKALGKFVILVDEKSSADTQTARYLEMLAEVSEVPFKKLQEGIAFLEQYRKLA